MAAYRLSTLLGVLLAFAVLVSGAQAEQRTLKVGVPTEALFELVRALAPRFQADTGIIVTGTQMASGKAVGDLDAVVIPDDWMSETSLTAVERRPVFMGDRILVGSRAERARVRGLKDIKSAFRAISLARGTFVSSSPELGARALELAIWDSLGVNVRTRLTWYVEVEGNEAAVLSSAGSLGAYVLVERATYAGMQNKRGLELLVAGDPLLNTSYSSVLVRAESDTGRAWHNWLATAPAQTGISEFRLNGMEIFRPGQGASEAPHPRPS